MANTNNYAEQFSPDLLEILVQGTLTSPFITSNVKWVGARTFHFTQMSTSGFKNHNRNGGWNKGKYVQTDVPFTLSLIHISEPTRPYRKSRMPSSA